MGSLGAAIAYSDSMTTREPRGGYSVITELSSFCVVDSTSVDQYSCVSRSKPVSAQSCVGACMPQPCPLRPHGSGPVGTLLPVHAKPRKLPFRLTSPFTILQIPRPLPRLRQTLHFLSLFE